MSTSRHRPAYLSLALCLLGLAGCHGERDRIILDFGQSIGAQGEVDDGMRQSIEHAFSPLGIAPDQMKFSLAPAVTTTSQAATTTNRLVVEFSKPLSATQREKARGLIDQILRARTAWQAGLKISAPAEAIAKDATAVAATPFQTRLLPEDSISLLYQKPLAGPLSTLDRSYPTQCSVRFGLDPAFSLTSDHPLDESQIKLEFASEALDRAFRNGKFSAALDLRLSAKNGQLELSANKLIFGFGMIGQSAQVGSLSVVTPQDQQDCVRQIGAAGRPFTFFYGKSLDLVQRAEYHFVDKPAANNG